MYDTYASRIKVFDIEIPSSVRASETSYKGNSIYEHDPKGKVAFAYTALTKEVKHIDMVYDRKIKAQLQ